MTRYPVDAVADRVRSLRPIGLADLVAEADLQTRVDRKYLLDAGEVVRLLEAAPQRLRVLEVDGLRTFDYESTYFDTPGLRQYHRHAYGRRRRSKIRTRHYRDSGDCMIEVKVAESGGRSRKVRAPYPAGYADRLTERARELLAAELRPEELDDLQPVLRTLYRRTTLLDSEAGCRITVDRGLVSTAPDRRHCWPDELAVVEIKSAGHRTDWDRHCWAAGHRPSSVSKYCLAAATLCPGLPANRWARVLAVVA